MAKKVTLKQPVDLGLTSWMCDACQCSCNPVLLRCPKCRALRKAKLFDLIEAVLLAKLPEYAQLSDGVDLIDQMLYRGFFTEQNLALWNGLNSLLFSVERNGARQEYLRLQRCDRDRQLLQRYRPALWARIVAEGQYTPSQQRRMAGRKAA